MSLRPGVDQPVVYATDPIKGASRALKAVAAIEGATGARPAMVSATQLELDQSLTVDLGPLFTGPNQVLLRSARLGSAEQLLEVVGRIDPSSLLGAGLHTVADTDEEGRFYSLISGPYSDPETIQSARRALSRLTEISFHYVGPHGPGNGLLLGDKVH
jgi:hypothetical protein